jgi:hypothetical protein
LLKPANTQNAFPSRSGSKQQQQQAAAAAAGTSTSTSSNNSDRSKKAQLASDMARTTWRVWL